MVPIWLRVPVNRNRTVISKFRDSMVWVYIRPYYGVIRHYMGVVTQEHANEMRKWAADAFDKARLGVYKCKLKEQYLALEG